jgi:hypothetical protein
MNSPNLRLAMEDQPSKQPALLKKKSTRFLVDHKSSEFEIEQQKKRRSASFEDRKDKIENLAIITKKQKQLKKIKYQYDNLYHDDGITYSQFLINQMYANPKSFYIKTEMRPRNETTASRKEPVILEVEVS